MGKRPVLSLCILFSYDRNFKGAQPIPGCAPFEGEKKRLSPGHSKIHIRLVLIFKLLVFFINKHYKDYIKSLQALNFYPRNWYAGVEVIFVQNLWNEVGAKVKQARKANKMTQEVLAEKRDSSPQYISRIERGKTGISLEFLYRLAETLGCSVYALLPATLSPQRSYFSQELEYQIQNCSAWKKQHIVNYIAWFLQQPSPAERN